MRLIDADRLETHEQLEPFGNGNYEYVEVVYKDDIDDAPTIEPERKKGEWDYIGGVIRYGCPFCHHAQERKSNFCPECGADMRGDNND